jgi:hypothetical protein
MVIHLIHVIKANTMALLPSLAREQYALAKRAAKYQEYIVRVLGRVLIRKICLGDFDMRLCVVRSDHRIEPARALTG